jgi:hypothetical protein
MRPEDDKFNSAPNLAQFRAIQYFQFILLGSRDFGTVRLFFLIFSYFMASFSNAPAFYQLTVHQGKTGRIM